jgi:hypothetical protein
MAATPYKAVSWGNEPVAQDKLNTMTNNDQWLYENTPRISYSTYGIKRTSGIKILAGIVVVPKSSTLNSSASADFGTFFSAGCKPVIVATVQRTSARGRYHLVIQGINSYYPDSQGFKVAIAADEVNVANNVIDTTPYVHYIAIGW